MNTPNAAQSNTFYEQIKNCQGLDLRDNRGKIHSLEFVLLGVIIALNHNRDGVLSSIQNMHDALQKYRQTGYSSGFSCTITNYFEKG